MKIKTLVNNPKLLKAKLQYGSISEFIKMARQIIIGRNLERNLTSIPKISSDVELLSELLIRIGYYYVKLHPCVDHRELDSLIELSQEFGFETVELKLGHGDYESTMCQNKTINIERKDNDFLPSLFDNKHIYEQLKAMDDNKENRASYLIVTKSWDEIKRDMELREKPIPTNVLIGYVAELIMMGYPPVFINDNEDFMKLINLIFEKYSNDPDRIKSVNKSMIISVKRDKKKIITFPGVKDVLSDRLLQEFGTIRNIINADKESLIKVKGIGDKIADEIIRLVN